MPPTDRDRDRELSDRAIIFPFGRGSQWSPMKMIVKRFCDLLLATVCARAPALLLLAQDGMGSYQMDEARLKGGGGGAGRSVMTIGIGIGIGIGIKQAPSGCQCQKIWRTHDLLKCRVT